jgi:hypothetical protein
MKPSEVMREARNVLFERGWTKLPNALGWIPEEDAPPVPLCIEGAVRLAKGEPVIEDEKPYLREAICERGGFGESPWEWNDRAATTFDDVIDVLERAEKLALIAEEPDA